MKKYILAIDQGTTSTRVCVFDQDGSLVTQAQEEFPQIFPQPGWVEHDPLDIWNSTKKTLASATEKIDKRQIAGIGITNQRETVVIWDRKTHQPVMNAIVWQCRRTQDFCEKLRKQKLAKKIQTKTGLVIDPYFSASKIHWILKNTPGTKQKALRQQLAAGTIDSFLLWKLTGGKSHKTDVSNASRTMLMNLKTLQWDAELLKIFGIPAGLLPQIEPSQSDFGVTHDLGVLPDGIPITGILGDQQAALFGQGCFESGQAKCTFGTGSFILLNSGSKAKMSKNKLLTTVAWQINKQKPVYAIEGGAFICGAAVQWLRDGLGILHHSSEVEKLAEQVTSSEGVEFIPALAGLGAPHWKAEARGLITGLTRGTTKAHIARATLEAMALQNVEILQAMQKDSGLKLKSLKVDGGAASNSLLMQMQADYLGSEVVRPKIFETTAFGAALMAGLGLGLWKNTSELLGVLKKDKSFIPAYSAKQRQQRFNSWIKSVRLLTEG